jgi:HK97 family phage portal protein
MPSLIRAFASVGRSESVGEVRKAAPTSGRGGGRGAGLDFLPWGAVGRPLQRDFSAEGYIEQGKTCSWVFACQDRLAGAVSSVPWRVQKRRGTEWEEDSGHEYEIAIEYPNDHLSRQYLMRMAVMHLCGTGNFLWRTVRARGRVDEFWPINPLLWMPVPSDDWIDRYERSPLGLQVRQGPRTYKPEEVIHGQLCDPLNPYWGLSPMRSISRVVDMDRRMVEWNRIAIENGAVPPGVLIDPSIQTDEQREEAEAAILAHYSGPERARVPLVLGGDGKWERMAMTPAEMDWMESRRWTLVEVCAAHGILPAMLFPDTKYANVGESIRYMWEHGARTLLELVQDALNTKLVPRRERASLWIHYDLSGVEVLKDNLATRLEGHERAVRSGVPINRSYVLFDLPLEPVEGGDDPLIPINLAPLKPPEEKPKPDEDEETPIPPPPAEEAEEVVNTLA